MSGRDGQPYAAPVDPEAAVLPGVGEGNLSLDSRGWAGRRALGETAVVNSLLLGLALASGILAARLLGPDGRGALALGTAVGGMTTVIVGFGLQQAFAYLVAARRDAAPLAASFGLWHGLFAGGLAVGVGWVLVPVLIHDETVDYVVRIGLLAVPGSLIATNIAGVFQGLRLGRPFNAARLVQPGAYCALIVGIALIADSVTPQAIAGAYAVAGATGAAVAYRLLSPSLRRLRPPSRGFVTSALRYGAIAGIGGAAYVANTHLAVPILGGLVGVRETGFYAIALSYAIPVSVVASAIAIHTFPDVAAAESDARSGLIRRRLIMTSAGLVPLAVGALVASPLLIPAVFGGEFRPAVSAAQILVVAQGIRGISYVLADIGRGLGRPGLPSVSEATGMVATVALLPLVVPKFGITGAAAVVAGANATVAVVLGVGIRRSIRTAR